jgi:hypothetical protein
MVAAGNQKSTSPFHADIGEWTVKSVLSHQQAAPSHDARRPAARLSPRTLVACFAVAILAATALACDSGEEPAIARAACADGRDNDRDGRTDFAGGDRGCKSKSDRTERDRAGPKRPPVPRRRRACSDKRDNDHDGLTDFAGKDPGCTAASDRTERDAAGKHRTACSDGKDNDHDGLTDFAGKDPECTSATDRAERR